MNLYEMYYNFSCLCFGSCYRLTIDRETEKMYYGTVALLGDKTPADRFALHKEKIDKINESIEGNTVYYRTHLFAESDEDARYKALKTVSSYLLNRVNRIYVDSDLYSFLKGFTLRKGFKGLLDTEPKYATKCKIRGAEIIFEDNGRFFASSDYIGTDICRPCMEEHCKSTNCFACDIGKYPDCRYLYLKER